MAKQSGITRRHLYGTLCRGGWPPKRTVSQTHYFASVCGSTEADRRAFTIFALQRIHLASQRGVAQLIRAQEPIPDGPCFLPPRGLLDLGVLPRGPLIHVPSKQGNKGPAPTWRSEAQRALSSLSIQNLLATIPVVHNPALASAAGALICIFYMRVVIVLSLCIEVK